MNKLDHIEKAQLKSNIPDFIPATPFAFTSGSRRARPRSDCRHFEGIVIARRGKGVGETITVRKTSFGVGVERIFRSARSSITSTSSNMGACVARNYISCAPCAASGPYPRARHSAAGVRRQQIA